MASADESPWNLTLSVDAARGGSDAMGGLGVEISRDFGDHLELGFAARAQSEFAQDYSDDQGRVYHLESGYTALLVKLKLPLSPRWEIGVPIETGTGLLHSTATAAKSGRSFSGPRRSSTGPNTRYTPSEWSQSSDSAPTGQSLWESAIAVPAPSELPWPTTVS